MTLNINLEFFFDRNDIILFDKSYVEGLEGLNQSVKAVLIDIGLPKAAAPEFQFYDKFEELSEGYVIIGDGIDFKAVVLDISKGIVYEESNRQDLKVINTHIKKFVYALQIYAEMVESAIVQNGSNAYRYNNIPDHLIDKFKLSLSDFDPDSLIGNSFWDIEITRLYSHVRDY